MHRLFLKQPDLVKTKKIVASSSIVPMQQTPLTIFSIILKLIKSHHQNKQTKNCHQHTHNLSSFTLHH
jgi:hypothetical protein